MLPAFQRSPPLPPPSSSQSSSSSFNNNNNNNNPYHHHHHHHCPHHHHHHHRNQQQQPQQQFHQYSPGDNNGFNEIIDVIPLSLQVQDESAYTLHHPIHQQPLPQPLTSPSPQQPPLPQLLPPSPSITKRCSSNNNHNNHNDNNNNSNRNRNNKKSTCCCCRILCCCCCCCCGNSCKESCAYKFNKVLLKFSRCFLIIPNIVFLIIGSTMIGMGVFMRSERDSYIYGEIINRVPVGPLLTYDKFPVVIIAMGTCILVLSFLGCCGACAESVCFLCLYTTFLIIIIITEISLAVLAYSMSHHIQLRLQQAMQHQIRHDYNNTDTSLLMTSALSDGQSDGDDSSLNSTYVRHMTTAWDRLQVQFTCCGGLGPEDYRYSHWYNNTKQLQQKQKQQHVTKVPPSCCKGLDDLDDQLSSDWLKIMKSCQSETTTYISAVEVGLHSNHGYLYLKTQGCNSTLIGLLKSNITFVIIIISTVVILQIIDFTFACLLIRYFKKKMMESSWYEEDPYD